MKRKIMKSVSMVCLTIMIGFMALLPVQADSYKLVKVQDGKEFAFCSSDDYDADTNTCAEGKELAHLQASVAVDESKNTATVTFTFENVSEAILNSTSMTFKDSAVIKTNFAIAATGTVATVSDESGTAHVSVSAGNIKGIADNNYTWDLGTVAADAEAATLSYKLTLNSPNSLTVDKAYDVIESVTPSFTTGEGADQLVVDDTIKYNSTNCTVPQIKLTKITENPKTDVSMQIIIIGSVALAAFGAAVYFSKNNKFSKI